MTSAGIRELKDRLSQFIRQVEAGGRIAVTAHGRVVAELVPPGARSGAGSRYDRLVAAGFIEPAAVAHAGALKWPDIRLAPGSVAALIASDRGEA